MTGRIHSSKKSSGGAARCPWAVLVLALAAFCTLQPCAASASPAGKNADKNKEAKTSATAPQDVDLKAPDGAKLKATYYAAGKPGPGVLLLHQCNRDRKMWAEVAPKLAASGLNVLALDFRGYGDSDGTAPFKLPPAEGQKQVREVWPGDVDTAYNYLVSQPGVKKDVIGAGGASCGVNQSIQLARRHPEVKSLVLLSGATDRDGRYFLRDTPRLPIFASAADDDQGAVEVLQWITGVSRNPGNKFQRYATGGHGIEMFAPHPELTGMIVNWFDTTLTRPPVRMAANKENAARPPSILETIDEPGGAAKAAQMLADARKRDPNANLFPEVIVNVIGYEHIQSGDTKGAIEIMKLNTTAYPNSPNTFDSLSDALLADGQKQAALENAEKAIKMLESDTADNEARRKAVRDSAEQKVKQIKGE